MKSTVTHSIVISKSISPLCVLPLIKFLLLVHINVWSASNLEPISRLVQIQTIFISVTPTEVIHSVSPLNLTSSTSLAFSMMSPLGLKVWQGQCTLISRPRLVSEGKTRAEGYGELTFFPRGHYPSFAFGGKSNKVRCEGKTRGVPLTSVHQPFPHCLGNIKGDPLRRSLGQDVLAPDVALFGFGVVFLKDL